jgi:hypothetical protein
MKDDPSSMSKGTSLLPVDLLTGESEFETQLLLSYLQDARSFLSGFAWCTELREQFFGVGVGGVIAVFLMEVVVKGVDHEWLWVITGDLPAAYISRDRAASPCEALIVYGTIVEQWVEAVCSGSLGRDVFALPVDATLETAALLGSKLRTLQRIVLPALCPEISVLP